MKKEFQIKKTIVLIVALLCILMMSKKTYADYNEPNSYKAEIGVKYSGNINYKNRDNGNNYSIRFKKGVFYKIKIFELYDDYDDTNSGFMSIDLSFNNKNREPDFYYINDGKYSEKEILFRAPNNDTVILAFLDRDGYTNTVTHYSFLIEEYNVLGKSEKGSDGNIYKITGNNTAELKKVTNKKKSKFDFLNDDDKGLYFSYINGMKVISDDYTWFKITTIGNKAFYKCLIKHIDIPREITKIGVGAFMNCKKLNGVCIYSNKIIIERKAFKNCKKIKSVIVYGSVKTLKKNAFKGTKKGCCVSVFKLKKYKKIFLKAGFDNPKFFTLFYEN